MDEEMMGEMGDGWMETAEDKMDDAELLGKGGG